MGAAIVAIPEANEHVWKVSSEKIPHLTMLFLGDNVPPEDLVRIASFLEHVANESMYRFGLDVEKRGTLGDEDADVLFFRKKYGEFRMVESARGFLLANELINKAYSSTDQFPEWTPHLTLGYPATPAKEDDRDFGISWVRFDRVALWIGDSEGPTFDLPEMESRSIAEDSAAWSGLMEVPMDELKHYGVKGMKWGVRKDRSGSGRKPAPSEDKATANSYAARVGRRGNTDNLSNRELQALVTRMNLESQYSKLDKSRIEKGRKFTKTTIETANTGKQAWNLLPGTVKAGIGKKVVSAAISAAVIAGTAVGKRKRK